jgi:hypothetical protein
LPPWPMPNTPIQSGFGIPIFQKTTFCISVTTTLKPLSATNILHIFLYIVNIQQQGFNNVPHCQKTS